MLFNVESDTGDRIVLYLVPDTYSVVPEIRVTSGGETLLEMKANEKRDALVAAGRHETGQCGFSFDSGIIPELASLDDLAIHDMDTSLLIYRRRPAAFIPKKVLNLSASLFPPQAFDAQLRRHFHYAATRIESHGHETVSQLFLLNEINSVYLSGRILYKNYATYIDNGFSVFMCIDDPYFALAERLLILAKIGQIGNPEPILGRRDAFMLQGAMEFAGTLPMSDGKALRRALRSLPPEIATAFVNPVVRLLTTNAPNEMARNGSVAWALDTLASCSVTGIRAEADLYSEMIADFLGLNRDNVPVIGSFPAIGELARLLREEAGIEHLIEKDLELYAFVEGAFATPE